MYPVSLLDAAALVSLSTCGSLKVCAEVDSQRVMAPVGSPLPHPHLFNPPWRKPQMTDWVCVCGIA